MHEDFLPHRIELLLDERRYAKLARVVCADLQQVAPGMDVRRHDTYLADP